MYSKYFNYGPRFNNVYSRDNLPRIKDGINVINLDDKESKGKYWVSLFIDKNTAAYFDSFGVEIFRKNYYTKSKINLSLTTYLEYKVMILLCRDFTVSLSQKICLQEKLIDYTNLFSLNDYKKNDHIIYKYFKDKYDKIESKP